MLATADFTHPVWLKEIETKLEPAEDGLFRLRDQFSDEDGEGSYVPAPVPEGGRDMRFILSTELCCIYKKGGKTRRLHLVVLAPTIKAVRKMTAYLERQGRNLKSDGRPILGMDAVEVMEMALDADEDCEVIPAHAWTPWFSVFGSQSGFDSLEECFGDLSSRIHAIETGLSSDPPMNWRLSALDRVVLVSNSDAHGLKNLAREANVFELDRLDYRSLLGSIRDHDPDRFRFTIEFFPEEGKYHADGHRTCGFVCGPEETERLGGKCPKCGKPLTRGVLGRVHQLADRQVGTRPDGNPDFRHIVPLEELIADAVGKTKAAKSVFVEYARLIERIGPEFDVLLDAKLADIEQVSSARIAEAIRRTRSGEILVSPGYDGEFGKIDAFSKKDETAQTRLQL